MYKSPSLPSRQRLQMAFLFVLAVLFADFRTQAQDSLFVVDEGNGLMIRIRVRHGDDLFLLSKRFKAPPAKVASLNGLSYQSGLRRGSYLKIPVGKYNYVAINTAVASRPIYYEVQAGESLRQISRKLNVPQSSVQRWNNLPEPEVEAGQLLQVGWIRYDASQVAFPDQEDEGEDGQDSDARDISATTGISENRNIRRKAPGLQQAGRLQKKDSLRKKDSLLSAVDSLNDSTTAYEREFYKHSGGRQLQERTGAVVFYTLEARVEEGVYYALFDGVSAGTIVEITNPSNGKVIYAKAIGALPDINDYRNAVMGLSNNAVRDLGATSRRIFCRIRY